MDLYTACMTLLYEIIFNARLHRHQPMLAFIAIIVSQVYLINDSATKLSSSMVFHIYAAATLPTKGVYPVLMSQLAEPPVSPLSANAPAPIDALCALRLKLTRPSFSCQMTEDENKGCPRKYIYFYDCMTCRPLSGLLQKAAPLRPTSLLPNPKPSRP